MAPSSHFEGSDKQLKEETSNINEHESPQEEESSDTTFSDQQSIGPSGSGNDDQIQLGDSLTDGIGSGDRIVGRSGCDRQGGIGLRQGRRLVDSESLAVAAKRVRTTDPNVQSTSTVNAAVPSAADDIPIHVSMDTEAEQGQALQCKRRCSKEKKNSRWTDGQMAAALQDHEQGASMREAASKHEIPYSTFRDWCYGVRKSRKRGGETVLSEEEERQLVEYLLRMSERGLGLSPVRLKMTVYEMTKTRRTPFKNGIPGDGWMRWFKHRHPELTLRRAETLSSSRAKGLCPENVQSFYDNISQLYTSHKYPPQRVWNCDESGVQAGRNGGAMVIARRGVHHVQRTIPDQREWLSVLVCINAAGSAIPSFYIFKGKRHRQNYLEHCEPGATMAVQPKAWMTSELFSAWITHFIHSIGQLGGISPTERHLLVVDEHSSHVSLEVAMTAKEAGLDIVTLPSHTSHTLQPLDVCVFGAFKNYFRQYRDYWVSRNLNRPASKQVLAQWVSLSLQRALSVRNVTNGFKGTGIYPLNRTAIDTQIGPSEAFKSAERPGEGGNDEMQGPQNPGECGGQSMQGNRPAQEDIPSLQDEEIERDLLLPANASTEQYFVDAGTSASGGADEVDGDDFSGDEFGGSDPDRNPNSITTLLQLPTATETSKPSKQSAHPVVDFSKSILVTSDAYINSIKEQQERNLQRARDEEAARICRQEAQRKKQAEQEERRHQREIRQRQVAEEKARKAEEKARKAAERARNAESREHAARQKRAHTARAEDGALPLRPARLGSEGDARPYSGAFPQSPPAIALENSQVTEGQQLVFANPVQPFLTPMHSMVQSQHAPMLPTVPHFQQFPVVHSVQTPWPGQDNVSNTQ